MAGSSPAMTGSVFRAIPALRSGMKNAAARPGNGIGRGREEKFNISALDNIPT
jgi:hypothetical protein